MPTAPGKPAPLDLGTPEIDMTLAQARLVSLSRLRKPENLRAVARELMLGNEHDYRRAEEFAAKANRIERQQIADFAASLETGR